MSLAQHPPTPPLWRRCFDRQWSSAGRTLCAARRSPLLGNRPSGAAAARRRAPAPAWRRGAAAVGLRHWTCPATAPASPLAAGAAPGGRRADRPGGEEGAAGSAALTSRAVAWRSLVAAPTHGGVAPRLAGPTAPRLAPTNASAAAPARAWSRLPAQPWAPASRLHRRRRRSTRRAFPARPSRPNRRPHPPVLHPRPIISPRLAPPPPPPPRRRLLLPQRISPTPAPSLPGTHPPRPGSPGLNRRPGLTGSTSKRGGPSVNGRQGLIRGRGATPDGWGQARGPFARAGWTCRCQCAPSPAAFQVLLLSRTGLAQSRRGNPSPWARMAPGRAD